jgi:phosphate transport system permease protein
MTDPQSRSSIREVVAQRLAKRYRAELRFRTAGIGAIVIAVSVLVLLLGSIAGRSMPAWTVNEVFLSVSLDEALVDPEGDRSEASLRRGFYSRILQNAMREQFPEVTARRDLRSLFQIYTALNSARLMTEVLEDPTLVGSTYEFRMPLADDLDLYLKGQLVDDRDLPVSSALVVEELGRDWQLQADAPDFMALLTEFSAALVDEAVALEARAEGFDAVANSGESDNTESLRRRAVEGRERAAELRAAAAAEDGEFTLSDDMPSVIVEMAGGAYKLNSLSTDGMSAVATRVVAPATSDGAENWTLYVIDTPASRRRVDDNRMIWTRALVERGVIAKGFNSYLFTNADSREPELAGVRGALFGSILTMVIIVLLSVPMGVFAAIYLEEFAPKNRFTDLIEVNINNLAAVPSIVFGLLGLAVFINVFGLPRSAPVLGGFVLSLMTLPTIIIASRAALKAVPPSIREAALGVGASQTQTVFHHVLPLATPGILTGSIIGLSRALGETAPLLMIGMVAFINEVPTLGLDGFTEPATVMPVQIYLWYDAAERAFQARAAAAILILLVLMIGFNSLAIYLRRRFERRW